MAILKEERIEAIVNRLTTSTMVTFLPTVKKPRRLLPRSVSRSIHHLEFLSTNRTQEVVLALPRADRSFSKYYSNADESEREKRRSTECVCERERERKEGRKLVSLTMRLFVNNDLYVINAGTILRRSLLHSRSSTFHRKEAGDEETVATAIAKVRNAVWNDLSPERRSIGFVTIRN